MTDILNLPYWKAETRMQVTVQLTETDLEEMNATPDQIEHGIAQTLDGGIEIEGCGKIYFAGFNVVVQVVD